MQKEWSNDNSIDSFQVPSSRILYAIGKNTLKKVIIFWRIYTNLVFFFNIGIFFIEELASAKCIRKLSPDKVLGRTSWVVTKHSQ